MRRTLVAALCLAAVAAPARAQTAAEKKATITYLQKIQNLDGGFRPDAKAKASSLRATSAALRALKYFGGVPADKGRAAHFVRVCFDKKAGAFADAPGGTPDVVVTAVGLMALVELKDPLKPYEKPALAYLDDKAKAFEQVRMAAAGLEAVGKSSPRKEEWLGMLSKMQNADGTFGEGMGVPRDTGGAAAAVLRLGGKLKKPDAVLKALNAGQRKDGGFGKADAKGSDLETTYRVMRTFRMLKSQPARAADCAKFVASCRNADGGYGVTPGAASAAGATYFAGIVLHWLGEK